MSCGEREARRPYDAGRMRELKELGGRGFLDEFVDAPGPCMNMLRVHHAIDTIVVGDETFHSDNVYPLLRTRAGAALSFATRKRRLAAAIRAAESTMPPLPL